MTKKTDLEYFKDREPDIYYVSKTFKFSESSPIRRFINKVFDHVEDNRIEKIKVTGEYVLRSSPNHRDQVKVLIFQDNKEIRDIVLQKFVNNNPKPLCFSFRGDELKKMLDFIVKIKKLDLTSETTLRIHESEVDAKSILVSFEEQNLLQAFKSMKGGDRVELLEKLRNQDLTKEDLDILSGRKKGLEEFCLNLYEESDWNEKRWQVFFSENTWIFGYGLDYQFLQILQKESSISSSDLDGKNTVFSDFLLGSNKFTVLVELKRPETPLFENGLNRSESWKLSKDLTYAVSQILVQKAEWEIKGTETQYDSLGNPISQKTFDPKTILIIGNSSQYSGIKKEERIKAKTFELYRRNSRNIEILTYSELYERAFFIVNQKTIDE